MPPDVYLVDQSADVVAQYVALVAVARAEGILPLFVRASRWIMEELARTPFELGESRERYLAAGIQGRIAFVGPIIVKFGVRESTRTVFINSVRMNHPRPFLPPPPAG